MDKANGDAPFIPLYGTAVPGAGWDGWRGCPLRACACAGDRPLRSPAFTRRSSF